MEVDEFKEEKVVSCNWEQARNEEFFAHNWRVTTIR